MSDPLQKPRDPELLVEHVTALSPGDMNDLCDATDDAIEGGGGFGWLELPARDILERHWNGVMAMPSRFLFVARLDGVICGTCQLIKPPVNNEAQRYNIQLKTHFVAPWARGHGLAKMLVQEAERVAKEEGFGVVNLDVRETMTRAMEIYESMGYERFGTHPAYAVVDGEILTGYYYYKVLNQETLQG